MEKARELEIEPMGSIVGFATAGVEPLYFGEGPVPAIQKLLKKTGLTLEDVDLFEINEAFASQILAVFKMLGMTNTDNVNVNGSGISLGHPIGCTGVRIMATLLYEMKRRNARYGLESMCVGGGQGMAIIVERK